MNKKDQQALEELQAYLDSRTEKSNSQSDKKIIALNELAKDPNWIKNVRKEAKRRSSDPVWSQQQKKAADKRFNGVNGKEERKSQAERGRRSMSSDAFIQARESLREETKRTVVTPFAKFNSYNEAQRNIHVDLANKLKELPHLYYYEDQGPGPTTYEKVYCSPHGFSNKRIDVYRFCQEAELPSALKNKHVANWWAKMCKLDPTAYYETTQEKQEWALKGILRNTNKRTTK